MMVSDRKLHLRLPRKYREARTAMRGRSSRESLRGRPKSHEKREVAEKLPESGDPAVRKAAVEALGRYRYRESYKPLLRALEAETERPVKLALLSALEGMGAEYCKVDFEEGFTVLKRFVTDNLADAGLVKAGLCALKQTTTLSRTEEAASDISELARKKGYTASEAAASDVYLDIVHMH